MIYIKACHIHVVGCSQSVAGDTLLTSLLIKDTLKWIPLIIALFRNLHEPAKYIEKERFFIKQKWPYELYVYIKSL